MTDTLATGIQDRIAPTGMLFTPDVHLLLAVMNAAAGVTVTFTGVYLDDRLQPVVFQQDLIPTTNRVPTTMVLPCSSGVVLSLDARASAGTPRRGQCFVRVSLIKGTTANAPSIGTLLQGYVQDTTVLGYPGSAIEPSTTGAGAIRSVQVAAPAAGADWTTTVPTNARWRIQAIRAALVASANAANRIPVLTIDDGATVLFESASAVTVVASQTATYAALAGVPFFTIGTRSYQLPLPAGLVLQGGHRIRMATAAIDAADQWGAAQLLVEEWIED
jgi:hypothetical protein